MTEKIIQVKSTSTVPNLINTPDVRSAAINDFAFLSDNVEVDGPADYLTFVMGTITMSGLATVDETFQIDTQTFTWKTTRGGTGEVTRGASKEEAAANIVVAMDLDLDLNTIQGVAADPADGTVYVMQIKAAIITFTENSTNMAMDGGGTLAYFFVGIEELEHLNIIGHGYTTRFVGNDLADYSATLEETGYVELFYRFQLWDDTDSVIVYDLLFPVYFQTWFSGVLSISSSTPYFQCETYQTLIDGHDYIWSMSWGKDRSGATNIISATSTNRNLTVQEIKR